MRHSITAVGIAATALALMLVFMGPAFGAGPGDVAGWEKDSAYNKHYDVNEFDELKGTVQAITEASPMAGMAPGVVLKVKDQDGDLVEVQLGPKSFVNVESIGLKKEDKVKVKGVWTEFDGKDVFMASKVKKGENVELKLRRTKDGVPLWTLSPEELAKEKES